jgi:hypothetical protein
MADLHTTETGAPPDDQGSILDALGALREQRAAKTLEDFPLPGFAGRLWARFRLPANQAKATQMSMFLMTDPNAEPPIYGDSGLARGFAHLPGGTDDMPVSFQDPRLERVQDGKLCPPRPHGREHTPESRARALFASDATIVQAAALVCGWALGGGEQTGAFADLSARFRAGDQRE